MSSIVTVHTSDDLYLQGILSETDEKKVLIIHIHGMQSDLFPGHTRFAHRYHEKGIAYLAIETRGSYISKKFPTSSGWKVLGGAYEIFEECIYDLEAWIDFALGLGYEQIWLDGESLAPAKIAYYLSQKHDVRITGLIFESPGDTIGLVKDPEGAADHALCMPEAQELVAAGKGEQLLSHMLWGDKVLSAHTYINILADDSQSNVFHFYDPARSWAVVEGITIPTIVFSGTRDDGIVPVMDPFEAMGLLKQKAFNCPRMETCVLDGAEHSFAGYEDQIVEKVFTFIFE